MENEIAKPNQTSSKKKIITIFILLILIISISTLVLAKSSAWWGVKDGSVRDSELTYHYEMEYGLESSQYVLLYPELQSDYEAPEPWYYEDSIDQLERTDNSFASFIFLLMDINIVCLISIIALFVSIIITSISFKKETSIYLPATWNFIVGILILAMPLALYFYFPNEWHTFMGSETLDMGGIGYNVAQYSEWGPRIGWYLSVISGSLMLASSAILVLFRKEFDTKSPMPFLKKRAKPIIMTIVSVLIVLALIFSYYNYMDLDGDGYVTVDDLFPNDPREWEDLDEDGIGDNFDNFFAGGYGYELEMFYDYTIHGSVTNDIAYRLYPRGGAGSDGDRIYVPSGQLGTQFWSHGLYAWDADSSIIWGGKPYETGSPISTDIEYMNFGEEDNIDGAEPIIFFGCEDGKIHVLRDGFDISSRNYAPSGNDVWTYQLDGAISGNVEVFKYRDSEFNNEDYFVVGTESGTLYIFTGPIQEWNSTTGETNFTQSSLLWEVHIADVPLTSSTIPRNREHVYVGTVDGILHGIDLLTGKPISEWNNNTYQVTDGHWSTSPVSIGFPYRLPPIVYTSTSDGKIHAVWGENGTAKIGWEGGLVLENEAGPDDGILTEIEMTSDGATIIVGSDTGYVYSINTASGDIIFAFDASIGGLETQCLAAPHYDSIYSKKLIITAICLNNTPDDISDDFSVIYCLVSTSNDTQMWRLTLPGRIYTSPITYIFNEHAGSQADLILITNQFDENGNENIATLYCFNVYARWIR